jgi:ribosomal protein S18 acetylase RimI-like enzyme
LFNLHEFNFFRKSEGANYLFFGNPRPLAPLVAVPYVFLCEIIFFRSKRFFVRLKERVVGILVVHEKPETLYINSLAVAPEYRMLGTGRSILEYSGELAARMGKPWLELSVLKTNTPARRLYERAGFSLFEERKRSLRLRRSVGK